MKKLKFAVLGCGFWSKFQIGAWSELDGIELVAVMGIKHIICQKQFVLSGQAMNLLLRD